MTDSLVVHGIVLSSQPVGEYDRRVSVLTKECGRITAFARGAQRPRSALVAAAQQFVTGTFTIVEGRTSNTLVQAEVSNYFTEFRSDVEKTCYGCYFCEMAEYITEENNDEREILTLLYHALRALNHAKIGLPLVRAVFELKMMYLNGEGPQVHECVRCRNAEGPFVFHVASGGCLCRNCAGEAFDEAGRKAAEMRTQTVLPGYFNMNPSTLYALRFIASTAAERLYTFAVSDEVLGELTGIAKEFLGHYLPHEFKSTAMLELF